MRKLLIMALTVFVLSTPVYAGGFYDTPELRPAYFNIGLGYAYNKYDGEIIEAPDGTDKIAGYLDLGVYVPMNEQMLVGGVFNASFDRLTDSHNSDTYSQMNTYLFGGSVLYYLNRVEEGLYFRGDIGFSYASITFSIDGHEGTGSSDWGMGFLVGAGYQIPFDYMSLGVNLFLSRKQILDDDNEHSATTVGAGLSVMF